MGIKCPALEDTLRANLGLDKLWLEKYRRESEVVWGVYSGVDKYHLFPVRGHSISKA